MAAYYGSQYIPMQLRYRRPIGKKSKRTSADGGLGWLHLKFVVGLQMVLGVIDVFEGVFCRQSREEHVLSRDQDIAFCRTLVRLGRPDLGQHITTSLRWRRPFEFLDPILGQCVRDPKIRVAEDVVGDSPAFRQRGR